jgi:6-phosphogluconolactonase
MGIIYMMRFYKTQTTEPAVNYIVDIIKKHLGMGEKVLWLVTGGSAIEVAVNASKKLNDFELSNLFVTLTDERFAPKGHMDSNWQQLIDSGFTLANAQLFPVLNNDDIGQTTANYEGVLQKIINQTDYRIGLFGMGPDGHIGALFPHFSQLKEEKKYVVALKNSPKPPSMRMTMTIPAIMNLDEAIISVRGSDRKEVIEKLNMDVSVDEQPAQILKKLPKLTIFNDQIGEEL